MKKEERLIKYLKEHPAELARLEMQIVNEKKPDLLEELEYLKQKKYDEIQIAKLKRATKMFDLFKEGHTYQTIGDIFEVTRERARQVMVEHFPEFNNVKDEVHKERRRVAREERESHVCPQCKEKFTCKGKPKYCSKLCKQKGMTKNDYPEWVAGRAIKESNFTKEEWREINRLRASWYYHRNRKRLNAKAREWRRNNKERFSLYQKRSQERKEFGEVLYTELPNPINIKAMKD